MARVHATAIVDARAELGDVEIGPYAVIGAGVTLADGVSVGAHAVVRGPTVIGPRTKIDAHAALGGDPQDLKHDGSPTRLVVGADNVFREFTSTHRGSSSGRGTTQIGDRNYFMANSHIAHDCVIGDDCMFANSAAVAGHVTVGDRVVLGGLAGVHQFVRVGRLAMVGAGAMCAQDVPPFTLAQGDRAKLFGLNVTGLRRAGFDTALLNALKHVWRVLFEGGAPSRTLLDHARSDHGAVREVAELIAFIEASERGVCRAAAGR